MPLSYSSSMIPLIDGSSASVACVIRHKILAMVNCSSRLYWPISDAPQLALQNERQKVLWRPDRRVFSDPFASQTCGMLHRSLNNGKSIVALLLEFAESIAYATLASLRVYHGMHIATTCGLSV